MPLGELYPGFAGAESPEDVLLHDAGLRAARWLAAARALGRASAPTFSQKGVELEQAVTEGRAAGVLDALLTQKGEPRKFSDKLAGLEDVRAAQERALQYCAAQAQHEAWLHQQRMARLTRLLIALLRGGQARARLGRHERRRAAPRICCWATPELWGWVQERLDARVRHLLIDEFQDTNPLQWQALHGWLGSYAGAGGRRPGVFIVGDPKQSIYRFRRAEPQVFIAAKHFVAARASAATCSTATTRTAMRRPWSALVNAVMQRCAAGGRVQRLPRPHHRVARSRAGCASCRRSRATRSRRRATRRRPTDGALPWRDSLTTPRVLPEEKLLQKECEQAARWIAERIARRRCAPSQHHGAGAPAQPAGRDAGRAAQAAHRRPAAREERPERRARGAGHGRAARCAGLAGPRPLAGARAEVAAVRRATTMRWCSWRCASARRAGASWFELLQARGPARAAAPASAPRLRQWQHWLAALPPHDALSAIYHDGDVLARFAAAAPAALRASVLANLRGLLARVARARRRALRDALCASCARSAPAACARPSVAAADAVQLLTVHGAKGLEADARADAGHRRARRSARRPWACWSKWPGQARRARALRVRRERERVRRPARVDALAEEQAARQREEINALYVATTRARSELVLSAVRRRTRRTRRAGGRGWKRAASPSTRRRPQRAAAGARRRSPRFAMLRCRCRRAPARTAASKRCAEARRHARLRAWARPCTACSNGRSPARRCRRRMCAPRRASSRWTLHGRACRRRDGAAHPCRARAPGPGTPARSTGRATKSR